MYNSPHLDPEAGPVQLRNKVEFDIRFYFCRRGKENLHDFTKEFFQLRHNEEQDLRYIVKVKDEQTKNHQGVDGPVISGHMPELKGSKFCPVTSYLTYLYSLDPKIDWLFQTPKMKQFPANGKGVWYTGRMGHNKLDTFVSRMAKLCGLESYRYSNHSLRSSGITELKQSKEFSDKTVMAFSGHVSLAGLNTYERVSDEDKMKMGFCLSEKLLVKKAPAQIEPPPGVVPPALPQPPPLQAIEAPPAGNQMQVLVPIQNQGEQLKENVAPENAIIPFEAGLDDPQPNIAFDDQGELDLLQYIAEAQQQEEQQVVASQQIEKHNNNVHITTKQLVQKKTTNSPKVPVFMGCTINGNITININKN